VKQLLDKIRIDLLSGTPAYLQILTQIQAFIAGKELLPGDQLPTVRQLAAQSGINFNTVARAYRLLDKAGLITTQQGRGTYVRAAGLDGPQERARQSAAELSETEPSEARHSDAKPSEARFREVILADLTASYLSQMQRMNFPIEMVIQAIHDQVDRLKEDRSDGSD